MEPNYEAIGRYQVLIRQANAQAQSRNGLLARAGLVLKAAAEPPHGPHPARRCNFEAILSLLTEAKAADTELARILDAILEIAPLANEMPLTWPSRPEM